MTLQPQRRHHEEAVHSIPFLVIAGPMALALARAAYLDWKDRLAKPAKKGSGQ